MEINDLVTRKQDGHRFTYIVVGTHPAIVGDEGGSTAEVSDIVTGARSTYRQSDLVKLPRQA